MRNPSEFALARFTPRAYALKVMYEASVQRTKTLQVITDRVTKFILIRISEFFGLLSGLCLSFNLMVNRLQLVLLKVNVQVACSIQKVYVR